jgi:hypothetical protein
MKKKHIHPEDITLLPPGKGWLMIEFGGANRDVSDAKARRLMNRLREKADAPASLTRGKGGRIRPYRR